MESAQHLHSASLSPATYIFIFIGYLCFVSVFLHIGSIIADIEDRSFARAIVGTFAGGTAGSLGLLFGPLAIIATPMASVIVVKIVYDTSFGKAFIAFAMGVISLMILAHILVSFVI